MKKYPRTPVSSASKKLPKKPATPTGRPARTATRTSAAEPAASTARGEVPAGYVAVLADMKQLIADSRRNALATVNRELVCLYWNIGRTIVRQQETAQWGDAVVERLANDLRLAFPDMKGLSRDNVFRMRQFFVSCRDLNRWFDTTFPAEEKVGAARRLSGGAMSSEDVGALRRQLPTEKVATASPPMAAAVVTGTSNGFRAELSGDLAELITRLSWTHHHIIMGAVNEPPERYFYMAMAARERWSVRELRRQIDSGLFLRYTSVRRDPEKCLPAEAEQGDLLPFKDHYILEFLGLSDAYSERELRKAILANLRDFFLEFGRDLTFVGEEYPLTIGNDTFYIDLVFFHRRLQCLIAVDLKIGSFQPEYVGKSLFYVVALDEQIRLPHENPSIGLILCRDADRAQVRIALTPAAKKVGVATYETALPDLRLIRQRLEQFVIPQETP